MTPSKSPQFVQQIVLNEMGQNAEIELTFCEDRIACVGENFQNHDSQNIVRKQIKKLNFGLELLQVVLKIDR
jgi:hypothetical protein